MSRSSSSRRWLGLFVAPVVVVTIGYGVIFQMPLERQLAQRVTKQQKLEDVSIRQRSETAEATERLAALKAEERSLSERLEDSRKVGERLVTQRADRRAELLRPASPASLVAQALELLARHGIACLDSVPTKATTTSDGSLEALKPVAELLGGTSGEKTCRREVRMKLAGSFEDMQAAVRDMHAVLPEIFTVSLEMESADGLTNRRIWILTISV